MDAGEWVVVGVAVLVAGSTLGVLLTRPVWSGAGRPGFVPALLGLHAGVVALLGGLTAAAAARSWQLVGRPPEEQAAALLEVSRTDGDGSMYALIVLALAFGTTLAVVALALGARFAAGDDPVERIVACAVIALEISVAGYGAARLVDGSRSAGPILLALQLPLLMLAMVRCWPPPEPVADR